jgi:phospholipase/carboxylesterase
MTDSPLEIETAPQATASVIWLHGLGADGYDFEGIVPMLGLPSSAAVRFVFPHAPVQPVTVNGGMHMRAWYDIVGIGPEYPQDEAGIRASEQRLHRWIATEVERGVPPAHIVLAGFSQGGAVVLHTGLRYPQRLAGIAALSSYLPLAAQLAGEAHAANRDVPILMVHGEHDPVVPLAFAEASRGRLERHGYAVQWHTFPMPHTICSDELAVIGAWLRRCLRLA